jgi:hypothetical protein
VGGSKIGSIIPGQEGLQFEDFQSLLLSRLSANKNSGLDTEETKTGPCLTSMENEWQDAALKGLELAKPYAPEAEAKWGDEGLEAIWNDKTIHAVAIVLPAQAQLNVVLQALQAGKHVIQGANSIYNIIQCFCHPLAVFSIGNFVCCSGLFWVTLSL